MKQLYFNGTQKGEWPSIKDVIVHHGGSWGDGSVTLEMPEQRFGITFREELIKRWDNFKPLSQYDESELKDELKRRGTLAIYWNVEDVKATAKDMKARLTKKELEIVVYSLEHTHDAMNGMNWDVISETIRMQVEERKKKTIL